MKFSCPSCPLTCDRNHCVIQLLDMIFGLMIIPWCSLLPKVSAHIKKTTAWQLKITSFVAWTQVNRQAL